MQIMLRHDRYVDNAQVIYELAVVQLLKINNGKLPNVLGLNTVTSTILTISQQFMRDQKVSYSTLYYFLVQGKFSLHSVNVISTEKTTGNNQFDPL
jgi:hypothetical protein